MIPPSTTTATITKSTVMTTTIVNTTTTNAAAAGPHARTHCIFRHGSRWLALPAASVREALPSPSLVNVPSTSDRFAGLCHLRSEFLPVLNLSNIPHDDVGRAERIMLVVNDSDSCWAVLADEVLTLAALEFSDAPEPGSDAVSSAVIGWATHNGHVVQILDPASLRDMAERELAERAAGRATSNTVWSA